MLCILYVFWGSRCKHKEKKDQNGKYKSKNEILFVDSEQDELLLHLTLNYMTTWVQDSVDWESCLYK